MSEILTVYMLIIFLFGINSNCFSVKAKTPDIIETKTCKKIMADLQEIEKSQSMIKNKKIANHVVINKNSKFVDHMVQFGFLTGLTLFFGVYRWNQGGFMWDHHHTLAVGFFSLSTIGAIHTFKNISYAFNIETLKKLDNNKYTKAAQNTAVIIGYGIGATSLIALIYQALSSK
jgi:hypothetical protein